MQEFKITSAILDSLYARQQKIRLNILQMITKAKSSHLGCSLGIVDLLNVLYGTVLDLEAIKAQQYPRDIFILSKGHSASALYATLSAVGLIPEADLATYYMNDSKLAGHPIRQMYPGIEASTGSLGHGLSLAVGFARALKDDGYQNRVFVLIGDGEAQEGSIWEAVEMAVRFELTNLTLIIDDNNLQGLNNTSELSGDTLTQRLQAFGMHVVDIDGHDYQQIIAAYEIKPTSGPLAIRAHTTKGKGISFMENRLAWHYKSPNPQEFERAHKELLGL
jgi:transketolase